MITVQHALQQALDALDQNDSPQFSAQRLLAKVLHTTREHILAHPDTELTREQAEQFTELVEQRAQGMPLAYLIGEQAFWSLPMIVLPSVLIPRPETELLVEHTLAAVKDIKQPKILELGTGSGAVSVALQHERPDAIITATDISPAVINVARLNAKKYKQHKIDWRLGAWFDAITVSDRFDVIVSNPPYVSESEYQDVSREVQHEPIQALCAKDHGLADLLHIIELSAKHVFSGGTLLLEHGFQQAEALQSKLTDGPWNSIETLHDLADLPRVTLAKRT